MKIKKRIKSYFTEKPKSDFWMWAFITLFLFSYVTPMALMMWVGFQVGLIAPEAEMDWNNVSINVAEAFVKPVETLHNAGKKIGTENPITSKILFYGLSYFIWVIYLAMLFLIINFCRYGIYYLFFRKKEKSK